MPDLRSMLIDNCAQNKDAGPMADVAGGMQDESMTMTERANNKPSKGKKKGGLRRD